MCLLRVLEGFRALSLRTDLPQNSKRLKQDQVIPMNEFIIALVAQ